MVSRSECTRYKFQIQKSEYGVKAQFTSLYLEYKFRKMYLAQENDMESRGKYLFGNQPRMLY